jgi:hypothetical protein
VYNGNAAAVTGVVMRLSGSQRNVVKLAAGTAVVHFMTDDNTQQGGFTLRYAAVGSPGQTIGAAAGRRL